MRIFCLNWNNMKLKPLISYLFIFLFLLTATGCDSPFKYQPTDYDIKKAVNPITLRYWRVWDGEDDFADIIAAYNALHPNITIEYRKFRYEEYEQALLEALAVDRGPDILSVHNTWTREYVNKDWLLPMPKKITMVFREVRGSVKKELFYQSQTYQTPSPNSIKTDYADVVYDDVVVPSVDQTTGAVSQKIYGLPLSIDTLALFYNKDLFNNANIVAPPDNWSDFNESVKKLTKQNNKGQIVQSGAAMGTGNNIERATDILSILMMQNGTVMMDNGQVLFQTKPAAFADRNLNPGSDALRYYTDFANPATEVYSWNNTLDDSLDMFINNKLAMMFGYSYMIPQIREQAPKLQYSIVSLPQIKGNTFTVNFANYWVEAVSKKSKYPEEAWDFILFMSRKDMVKTYLDKTKNPTALRSLIEGQKDNPEISVFANQILTAKSWYKGNDSDAAETIIKEMIDKMNKGQGGIQQIMDTAAQKIQQTVHQQL